MTLLDGTDRWAHAAAGIDADSVVLAAAFDRSPAPVKALLRLARRREATSILLTNRRTGPLPPLADVLLTTTSPAQDAMFRTRAATLVVLEELLDAVAAHLRRDRHFRTRSAVTPSTSYENVYLDGSGQHAAQAVTFLSHSHRIRQATDTLARRLAPRRRPPQREEHPMPAKPSVIADPLTNRGTAFTAEERRRLGILGRFPSAVETLDEQAARSYAQLRSFATDLDKYVFLDQLHNRNEVLYYRVLTDHLAELLPIVYDPTVGEAIKKWSRDYRRSRAVYLSIDRIEDVRPSFEALGLGPGDVDLLVVSDAEEILGIGDWGVNGTDISVGKLAVYTAAAGIHPERAIAVNLDCGTDNEALLNDPAYLGNRHARVRGARYDALIDEYLAVASELFPGALLHFEDFGPANARRILQANRERYRIFNDDMQGTGAIVMAAVVSGMRVTGQTFADQRLVVYGAGTAGTGMADQIHAGMVRDGLSPEEATARIWLVDRAGLVTDDMTGLPDYQRAYARPAAEAAGWQRSSRGAVELLEVVRRARPTVLIGTSTNHGAFTREVVEAVSAGVERPIILPLSNPTERIEAMPEDVVAWSRGKALVATGIPVAPFDYEGTTFTIGQGNNALLYPGLGLGVIVSGASRVTDGMLLAAAQAVAGQVDPTEPGASLLPPVENLRASSATVAVAVARQAQADGVATASHDNLIQAVQDAMWQPVYGNLEA
ncbi:oxaloacetate-decarboxylating malate dehydrogenase [Actinomyces israelii]|uniref:oxaloacetate-decarboxylating malate dehydrogenase n=1 Tax=Actinomyces israelii TaxID=1659 RepID=UPI002353BDFF|nr:oxaloacetate-decarboxylating malate dehydrogenase [Actinomyces israelii]